MAYKQKNYRKFVATAATATLVASAVAPLASAASFTDVAPQYKEPVDFVFSKGANGLTETSFGVNENIKRVDAAVLLVKVLGLDIDAAKDSGFTDVPDRAVKYINALKEAGITTGKTPTSFDSHALITRGELAIWIQRAFDLKGSGDVAFSDVNNRYTDAVSALVDYKITNGINKTQFGTDNNAKRGDFAIFLMKSANAEQAPTVTKVEVLDATTLSVTLSNNKVEKVTLKQALVPSKETEVTFEINGVEYTEKVVFKVADPDVDSVKSINATQVEVKFNTAVDAKSLFTNGKDGEFKATVTVKSLDGEAAGTLSGTLSVDGKTLTVTSTKALSKRYDVVVDHVKTTTDKDVAKYEEMITIAADKTAPTIVSTAKVSASQVKVTFSEPVKSLGTVSYKLADGTVVTTVSHDFKEGAQEVIFTLGSEIKANAEVVATFIGLQDQAGNLLTPNPATVSLVKGDLDGVAPTVTSITQLGATKFVVKFSEQLQANPTVTLSGATVTSIEKDANDATQYIVTTSDILAGAATVAVSDFTDLSGEKGSATSKVVTFVKDTAASKVVSCAVVTDETTKQQYLEITFDKDVVLGASATADGVGSYVKDHVTTSIKADDLAVSTVSYKTDDNKKVIRVELDAFLGDKFDVDGATYTLNLAFAGIKSEAGVAVEGQEVSFNRGKDGVAANTAVVSVASIAQQATDNSKVEVTFDKAVDGATATNVANYAIDGAVVESVTLQPVKADGTQVAVLNLKAGSNGFTGVRNYTIKNIKALGSTKVMEEKAATISLKENVAPIVVSATLTDTNKVKLTFSEAVSDEAGLDFEVLVGGKSQATAEKVSLASSTKSLTADLTIAKVDADKLAKGIALKGLSTLDIVDEAGNKLSVPVNVAVTQ